jgi:sucrose-6-phosphate hydrolase SacC (GH32 family)
MAIWLATSEDQLNWKNIQDEPILPLGPDRYDIAAVATNQVVKYKDQYYLYYHATSRLDWQNPASPVEWSSNVAMSADLIHWVKYPYNPIVQGDHSSPILVFDGENPSLYTMHSEVCRYVHRNK